MPTPRDTTLESIRGKPEILAAEDAYGVAMCLCRQKELLDAVYTLAQRALVCSAQYRRVMLRARDRILDRARDELITELAELDRLGVY